MKALSLTQPWGWLVVFGGKTIENRTWNTRLRGDFLIHAAKGMTATDYERAVAFVRDVVGDHDLVRRIPAKDQLDRGGIIGRARLVDVIPPCASIEKDSPRCVCIRGSRWHMGRLYGFLLEDIQPLPFRPLKALQRFFDPDHPNRQIERVA